MAIELPVKVKVEGVPETQTAFSNLARSWDLTKVAAVGLVGAIGGLAILNTTKKLFLDARREAQEYNTLQIQLKTSLGYTSGALNAQAAAMGKQLHMHDEEISKVQLLLSNYVKNEDQIRRLTPAVFDLAAALEVDFNNAAQIVARSISGSNDQIGRYKIHIKGAADSTERIDSIITALTNRFHGQAEAVADNKDWFDKLTLSISETAKSAYNLFLHYDKVKKQSEAEATIAMIGYYNNILKHEEDYNQKVIDNAKQRLKELYASPEGEALRTASYDKTMTASMQAAADQRKLTEKLQKELWKLTDEGKIKLLQKERKDELANTRLTGDQRKLIEQRYAIEIAEIRKGIEEKEKEKPVKIAEGQEPWYADPKYNEEMARQAKEREDLLQASEENIAGLEDAATDDQYARRAKQIQKEHNKEQAELKKFLKLKLITQKQYDDATALNDKITDKEMSDNKKKFRTEILTGSLDMMSQLTAGSKKAAGLHKTIAIGESLVSAGQAELGVLENSGKFIKWLGPIAGPITMGVEMALIAGLAAEQIANIASAKMAYGGVATGGTPGQDSVPALLMPGEVAINPRHPRPDLLARIGASYNDNSSVTSSSHYNVPVSIVIHGNPTNSTIARVEEISQRAVLAALKRAQNMGKLSASGLTIRH